jgi:signal transduction histidine kinase/DNA-binding response OmpR family regulator/predicted RNA-binding protein with RPS1 domain
MEVQVMAVWKSGQVVAVKVIKHRSGGLLVSLPDRQTGMIRTREISWDARQRLDWQQNYPPGWQSEAVVIKTGGDHIELSLRFLQKDPWLELDERFGVRGQDNPVIEGVVTGAKHYGVFVEILPGINGLLPAEILPAWCKKDPTELFWPGDKVRVTIKKIDKEQKQVDLELAPAWLTVQNGQPHPTQFVPPSPSIQAHLPFELLAKQKTRSVLVIEDDPEQAMAVVNYLKNLNQRVNHAVSGEAGLEQVMRDPPDLALVDFRLPGISGIETIQRIKAVYPSVNCFLNTDWTLAEDKLPEIEELQAAGVRLLYKPLESNDLLDALLDGQLNAESEPLQNPIFPASEPSLTDLNSITDHSTLKKLVERCRRITEFDMAVLFAMDPGERKVEIAVMRGVSDPLPVLDDLIYSPVRDVAEDDDVVLVDDIDAGAYHDRFRYLLKVFAFKACLGVKVPGQLPADHALFLLSQKARTIYEDEVVFAQATALAIGAILEKKVFLNQIAASQKMVMMGHLSRNLVHEVNNGLSLLNTSINNLAIQWANVIGSQDNPEAFKSEIGQTSTDLEHIQRSVHNLASTVKTARNVIALENTQVIRLDEMVQQEIQSLLCERIRESQVKVRVDPGDSLMFIRSQVPQLQQVLLNLLLNAIEQVSMLRPGKGGQVIVGFDRVEGTDGTPLQRILIHDDGPGIHRRLWEKIFESGFTTRKGGSGLGLYISRYIIAGMGGKIHVVDSHILQGSTFAVDLPFQF